MRVEECSGILVYIELDGPEVSEVSFELIGEALDLAQSQDQAVHGVLIGAAAEAACRQLHGYSLQTVYCYETAAAFRADVYAKALTDCIEELKPAIVLIGGTKRGRALAPRIAVHFRTGLTADCTQLEIDERGQLVQIRPAFGGNIMASILTEQSRPQIATVRPGIFRRPKRAENQKIAGIIRRNLSEKQSQSILLSQSEVAKIPGIEQQELLVVAGRGVKKQEDLQLLRKLAAALGGALASSRALVEKGWMKPEEQIGLSGNTVAPQCMLTFGVSGTVQFAAGMKNTPNIIAVNNDPNAKIFEIAHYPICADLYDVVPELLDQLEK